MTEYQNMLARLSTIFAQQKALVTRLSRPLPMTPDDINVVRAARRLGSHLGLGSGLRSG